MNKKVLISLAAVCALFLCAECKKGSDDSKPPGQNPGPVTNDVEFWLTKADKSVLLQKQGGTLGFTTTTNNYPFVDVDSTVAYQAVDGFGYTLTGSSALLINSMDVAQRDALLNDLFSSSGIRISYIRVSIGASDLSPSVFSYDDMPAGQTDPTLANFNLSQDLTHLVPVLQKIKTINPNIKILGSPWSPPAWMKTNGSTIGGNLKTEYYSVYAQYFVKYIQAMNALGITINAVTIQNEPEHGGNNPSMLMTAPQQADFIKNHLGPAFQSASLSTKIIIWDHNCDNPGYPLAILNDPAAKAFVDGSAFHLYAGDINAMSSVHDAHPDKNVYFTEQWTSSSGQFAGDLKWHMKNVIIGSLRNWSKATLEWNLANDQNIGPHTPGGCTECLGALTINANTITKNVAYYVIAHASKFVPSGSTRISSNVLSNLSNVAFKRADGKKVLIVINEANASKAFNIRYKGKWALTTLPAGATGTYIW